MALCLCLSQVGVLSKRLNESIGVVLAWDLLSAYPTLCYKEIQVPSKIRVLLSRTLLQTLDFKKFHHSISIVKACYQLSSRKVDHGWSTELIIPPSSDARPLWFIAEIVKLCLQHDYLFS